jgi:transposase
MKGVEVYYSIKVLRKRKLSIREISEKINVCTSTVNKYLKMTEEEAIEKLSGVKRRSDFDYARDYIIGMLKAYPKLKSSKLYIKVKAEYPIIKSKDRSFRDYISGLRKKYGKGSSREYHPIQTDKPGYQVQVDIGEMKLVLIDGSDLKIYFLAFVFCFSRQKYFYIQDRPFNTGDFIRGHKEAFAFFGGTAQEYIYDQTKLVAISERYREVWFNKEFEKFAAETGFTPTVCEGYDPESKGKVERVIRDIKEDFLYGESFRGLEEIRAESLVWLEKVNNTRHSTTGELPSVLFSEEKKMFKPYKPEYEPVRRLVDKVGLISYNGNKYSVPSSYQQKYVFIREVEGRYLLALDLDTKEEVARHKLSDMKGQRIINSNHYRNYEDTAAELKAKCLEELKQCPGSDMMIEKLIKDNPKIVRDQLRGLSHIYRHNQDQDWQRIIDFSLCLNDLKISVISDLIERNKKQKQIEEAKSNLTNLRLIHAKPHTSVLDRPLSKYNEVVKC